MESSEARMHLPLPLAVTVSASYNSGRLNKQGVKVYYIKNEWYDLGITEQESYGGHIIRLYDMERSICDIARRYNEMDIAVFNYVATEYVKSKDKNFSKLSSYAAMDIDTTLRNLPLSPQNAEKIIENVIAIPIDDNIRFTIKSVTDIMDEAEYGGVRLSLDAYLDAMRIPLKIR